jgi:anti-sigma regulatory factor (Ser/Thr protein kinase)
VLLIDMDTLAVGNPIFELAPMYAAFIGYGELDHDNIREFLGFSFETAYAFWRKCLAKYLGTNDEKKLQQVEDKARVLAYVRMIRRLIRRKGLEDEKKRAEIEHWKKNLLELLPKVDSLTFVLNELDIEATVDNLPKVVDFIGQHLEEAECSMKDQMQIELAVEEVFVNIANYAYTPGKGHAIVRVEVTEEPICVTITFIDEGNPYDPLAREDPDVTLSAEDRQIGGLGIFMVKKSVDDVNYEYKDGQNILTLKKNL